MPGMLTTIENMAADLNVPIDAVIMRVLLLARRLNHQPLIDWATYELEGYPASAPVPNYRMSPSSLTIKARVTNGFRRDEIPVPYELFPEDLIDQIARPELREPVSNYLGLDRHQKYLIPENETVRAFVERHVPDFVCELVYREVPYGLLARVGSTARTRILAFMAELREQSPELDLESIPPDASSTAVLDRALTVTIYAGSGPIHLGSGSITQLNIQAVVPGDVKSLITYVSGLRGSLTDEDILELEGIIKDATVDDLEEESSRLRRWVDSTRDKVASAAGPLAGKAVGEAVVLAVRQFFDKLPDLF